MKTMLLFVTLCTMTACYRMPTADDYSLVPRTNNTDLTRDKSTSMPAAKY